MFEKTVKTRYSQLSRYMQRLRRHATAFSKIGLLLERHAVLWALSRGAYVALITMGPIIGVWSLFAWFLTIPNEWLRTVLIWGLIFTLTALSAAVDYQRKHMGI